MHAGHYALHVAVNHLKHRLADARMMRMLTTT